MQIHKATAEKLGVKMNRLGFYEASAGETLTIAQHNQIIAQIQAELKAHYQGSIEFLKRELDAAYELKANYIPVK